MVNMGVLGSLIVEISAEGADEARGDMEGMQKATHKAGNEAKKQVPIIEKMGKRWSSILSLVAASGAVAFGLIAKSSPSVMASLKGIQLAFEDIFMVIGEELSPVFETLEGALFAISEWFNDLSPTTKTFLAGLALGVIVVGALAAAFLAAVVAAPLIASAIAAVGLGASTVAAIVGALVVGIALLYTAWRNNWFKIRDIVEFTASRIKENWRTLMDILHDENTTTWEKIVGVVKWAWNSIKDAMMDSFDVAYNYITGKIDNLKSLLSSLASKIKSAFSSSSGSSTQSDGGGTQVAAGASVKARAFSGRAMGGTVISGASYLVGENGPELFTPGQTGNITPNAQTMQGMRSGNNEAPIELNQKIEVTLDGRKIWESLRRYQGTELRRLGV